MTHGRETGVLLFLAAHAITLDHFVEPVTAALRSRGYTCVTASAGHPQGAGHGEHVPLPPFRAGSPWSLLRGLAQMYLLMRRLRPALVALHTPYAVILGRIAARLAGVPSLTVVHGTPFGTAGRDVVVFRQLERWTSRLSRSTVVLNAEDYGDYAAWMPSNSLNLAPCGGLGIDAIVVPESRVNQPPGPHYACVGRLHPAKRPGLVLDAFRIVQNDEPRATLVLVGAPDGWELPGDLPVGATILPWSDDVPSVLLQADVLVSASSREGFGMVCAEAVAVGTRVVSTTNRGARQVASLAPQHCLLVATNPTAAELAAAMLTSARSSRLSPELPGPWHRQYVIDWHVSIIEAALVRPTP